MIVLSIDTSTLMGSVGWIHISDESAESASPSILRHAEIVAPARPGHAETLLDRIETTLKYGDLDWSDVNLIAFGRGPGTFTGLRIGLSTVKGLSIAHNIPIVGVSSLEAIALGVGPNRRVASLIDARRKELFCGIYEVSRDGYSRKARALVDEWVGPAKQIVDQVQKLSEEEEILVAGNGISPYEKVLADTLGEKGLFAPPSQWTPHPFWIALTGHRAFVEEGPDNLVDSEPVYLREPDAKLPNTVLRGK